MSNDLWNGNGNWTGNPADWSNGVPTPTETAEIQTGGVTLTAPTTVAAVQVDPNSTLYVGKAGSLTVSGGLTNNGAFDVVSNYGDGAGDVTIGGTLANDDVINIGNSDLTSPITVTAAALTNTGSTTINLVGNGAEGSAHRATLDIAGAAPTMLTQNINLYGDSLLEFGSGGVQTLASGDQLLLDGGAAQFDIAGASGSNSALAGLQNNAGTFDLEGNWNVGPGGVDLTTTVGFTNIGALNVDNAGGAGGSDLSIGGVLYNVGAVTIGNYALSVPTTVTATGLVGPGSLILQGNDTAYTDDVATLQITGAAPVALTGNLTVEGDADLQFASGGIQAVGPGTTLLINGIGAEISINGGAANSGLATLSYNAGTLALEGDWNVGPGGVSLSTSVGFNNLSTFDVDNDGNGGSDISIGGVFSNYGTTIIGNYTLAAPTNVLATGYVNTGTLSIAGRNAYQSIDQATLNISANAPAVLTGSVNLYGDALLEFAANVEAASASVKTNASGGGDSGFTSIGYGASLLLEGSQARISIGASAYNSALSELDLNNGVFNLEGNYNSTVGGVTVSTYASYVNLDVSYVDWGGGAGGSTLSLGGALTNSGYVNGASLATLDIGNTSLSAPTTVTATALSTTGVLNLYGSTALDAANQAALDISGAAPTSVDGAWTVIGDALMEFASGSVTTIDYKSSLEVDGAEAQISDQGGAANSALSSLSGNYGTVTLRGNSGNGVGAGSFTTTVALLSYDLYIDSNNGDGGTTVTLGGGLTNTNNLYIGNGGSSASTSVTATGLTNDGSLVLQGNTASGATDQALLDINSAAPVTLTGSVYVRGDAELEFKSGSVAAVGFGALLEIDGSQADVSDAGGNANSALSGLSTVAGRLLLRGASNYGAGADTVTTSVGMTVTGELDVDEYGGDGGSKLTVDGELLNRGLVNIGNTGPSAGTVASTTAVVNYGTFNIYGDSSFAGELSDSGAAYNDGSLNIGASAEFVAVGAFVQGAGTTTVAGSLSASVVYAEGGLIDFTTAMTSTGTLDIFGGGVMEFGAADSKAVNFKATTGTLELGAPASFTGTIAGFGGNDVIDLLGASVTGLAYSGGVLTVTGASGTIASLSFSGSYSQTSFVSVSDGHGGSDILLNPVVQWNGSNADWTTSGDWTSPPTSTTDAVLAAPGGYTVTVTTAITVGSIDITDTSATLYVESPGLTTTVESNLLNAGGFAVDSGGQQGGSTVKIGGALVNIGTMTIGSSSLATPTSVTAAALYNSGNINLWGNQTLGTTEQTTLDITGAAPAILTGNLYVHGDSDVEFGSGGVTTIAYGAELQLDGVQSRLSIGAGTANSALSSLSVNAGTLDFEGNWTTGPGGSSVTTTVGLSNSGALDLDVYGNDGDSSLKIGGALVNSGTVTIGNSGLSANTTLTATAFTNYGSLNLWGSSAASPTNQATLDITGGAAAILTGDWYIHGDALVEFASGGITTIAFGSELQLDGAYARVASGGTTGNTALSGLGVNAGTLDFEGNWNTGPGGSSVTTTVGLTNTGTLELDIYGGDGASTFAIGGTLVNSGTVTVGNDGLSADTTLSAKGLVNNGTVTLWGNQTLGTTKQAILDITGAASAALTGNLYLHGDALVEFASGYIASIAEGIELQLDGAQSVMETGGVAGNSALSRLSSISGTFDMEGNWSTGPGGSVVTTTVGLTNYGTLSLDVYGGDGDSSLKIGGGLVNAGAVSIGNTALTNNTAVSATALTNEGVIDLQGNTVVNATHQAALDMSGAAAGAVTGTIYVRGDAALAFASGSFASIAAGAFLEIDGAQAVVSDGDGTNSALSKLSTVTGRLLLRGGSNFGAGADTLTTSAGMTVTGELDVDEYGGDGGSTLSIGGQLANTGTLIFGDTGSSAATTVTATSFVNRGAVSLSADSTHATTMTVSGNISNYGTNSIGSYSTLNDSGYSYLQYAGTTTVAGVLEGTIFDEGGLIDFTSPLTSGDGTGALYIYSGATMEFGAGVDTSHTVTFKSGAGDLELGAPASFAGTVAGFGGNDIIDLMNTIVTSLSYSGHTLTVDNGSTPVAQLTFSGNYTTSSFTYVSDNHGGTDILDPPIGSASSHATAAFAPDVSQMLTAPTHA